MWTTKEAGKNQRRIKSAHVQKKGKIKAKIKKMQRFREPTDYIKNEKKVARNKTDDGYQVKLGSDAENLQ